MNELTILFIVLAVSIIIFLICREIICWYWKINERLDIQRDIRNSLNAIQEAVAPESIEKKSSKPLDSLLDEDVEPGQVPKKIMGMNLDSKI